MRRFLAFFALAIGVCIAASALPPPSAGADPQPEFFFYTPASGSLETPHLSLPGVTSDEDDSDIPEPEARVFHPAAASCRFGLAATRRITRKLWAARIESGASQPVIAESFLKLPAERRYVELQVALDHSGRGPPSF